jgi:hypothetical protein
MWNKFIKKLEMHLNLANIYKQEIKNIRQQNRDLRIEKNARMHDEMNNRTLDVAMDGQSLDALKQTL